MRILNKKVKQKISNGKKPAKNTAVLMIQGSGSDVGKSTLVAALARIYARRGLRVMPFKPQNMSNNAAATSDGAEIARAQAVQALAAGVATTAAMNPVLLKPQGDGTSQLVVMGKRRAVVKAANWRSLKAKLAGEVVAAFASLAEDADLVLVEGAGSPAEINLREGDIANMGFALMVSAPTILVADIHRGGSGAQIVGTWQFLSRAEQKLVKGYILNRFRGNKALLGDLRPQIEKRCGLGCLGVMPFAAAATHLPLEDSLTLERAIFSPKKDDHKKNDRRARVAVAKLPHISNFDDLDPLRADGRFSLVMAKADEPLPECELALLCGSKAVRRDLAELRKRGWDVDLKARARRGGMILGVCGGYQMLGEEIADPHGFEGEPGADPGLALLPIKTAIGAEKRVEQRQAEIYGIRLKGYLMHQGVSITTASARRFCLGEDGEELGLEQGSVAGCYLHGLFASGRLRDELYSRLTDSSLQGEPSADHSIEGYLNELADTAAANLDTEALLRIANGK